MNRNNDGWIAVSEGPTGVWLFVGEENALPADLPTYPDAGTGSIALQNGSSTVYLYHETDGWKELQLGGVSPEGTLLIVANGTYNVRDKATVAVNVQAVSNEDALIENTVSEYVNRSAQGIGDYGLYRRSELTDLTMESATSIGNFGCAYCTKLEEASFPEVLTIGMYAFQEDSKLREVSIPKAKTIDTAAFASRNKLETLTAGSLETIGTQAFDGCSKLADVDLSGVTMINGTAFRNCATLTEVDAPLCKEIGSSAFYGCSSISEAEVPAVSYLSDSAFANCTSLVKADIGETCSLPSHNTPSIGKYAFNGCSSLTAFIIRYDVKLYMLSATTAFNGTPIASGTGFIYVPDALVDSYKAATNWSTYAAQIKGLSELPA